MFIKRFEVGKKYWCVGLYGDEYIIKVVDRTEKIISFIYDESTSDDRSVQTRGIEIQKCTVYDKSLKVIKEIETESMVAWKYHSKYANPNEYNYGYYYAFDSDRLYSPEEWEEIKGSMEEVDKQVGE